MGKSFFLGTEADLYTGSANFSTKISSTPTAYGLVAAQATAYAALNAAWASAYNAAIDPLTRTKGKISAKNQAKRNLKAMASDLAKIIQGTPSVTDEQRIELGLNVRATPAPVPPPSVRPAVDLVAVVGRRVSVRVRDSATSSKRGKPAGCLGANVYSFVGASYPTDPTGWQFEGATTKSKFDVFFPDSVAAGAAVWICATWFNRRAQSGPISMPIMTYLQFGMSAAA